MVAFLFSCEKEDFTDEIEAIEQSGSLNKYSIEEANLTALDDKNLQNKIISFNKSALLSRGGESFPIAIDTSYCKILTNLTNGKKSYTFLLNHQKGKPYENIIFSELQDGKYETLFATYDISKTDADLITAGNRIVIDSKAVTIIPINLDSTMETASLGDGGCMEVQPVWVAGSSCASGEHGYGDDDCIYIGSSNAATSGYMTFEAVDCGSGGGEGEDTVPVPNEYDYPGENYYGGIGGGIGTTPIFEITTLTPEQIRKKVFFKNLDQETKDCLPNLTEEEFGEVMTFLEGDDLTILGDSYPVETAAFAEQAFKTKCDGGDVDFENRIFELFEGTNADCVHDKLKEIDLENPNITLYHILLNNFNDATSNWLFFEVGEIGDDWGQTNGYVGNSANSILPDAYTIVIDNDLNQNGSNLAIMATLAHELIHAYMFDTLSDAGVITFDQNTGVPKLNVICQDGTNYNNLNLNTLSTSERFSALICAMEASNTLSPQWSHDLFNENVFSVTTYQQQLADYIFENHDWSSEPQFLITSFDTAFGSDWKTMISQIISWRGLEKTDAFENWATQNDIEFFFDSEGNIAGQYGGYITTIKNFGNKNCN